MSITHGSATRGDLAQAVLDSSDAGSSFAKVVITTSADAVLGEITLQKPSYSLSGAVLTGIGLPLSNDATGTGTAAKGKVVDSDDTVVYEGTCAQSDADFIIQNISVVSGQPLTLTALSYTASV